MAVASVATPLNELGAFSSWSNQRVILPILRFPRHFLRIFEMAGKFQTYIRPTRILFQ